MGLGSPTLAEVTPTHACPMPGPQATPVTASSQQVRRPREVKHPQRQTLGLKEGVNLDLQALLPRRPTSVLT